MDASGWGTKFATARAPGDPVLVRATLTRGSPTVIVDDSTFNVAEHFSEPVYGRGVPPKAHISAVFSARVFGMVWEATESRTGLLMVGDGETCRLVINDGD